MLSQRPNLQSLLCTKATEEVRSGNYVGCMQIKFLSKSGNRQCKSIIRSQKSEDGARQLFNRRDVLLGTTAGVAGFPSLINSAIGAPIVPPDLSDCKVSTPAGEDEVNCCLKTSKSIKDFVLPKNPSLRTRPVAHLVDQEYIDKYVKAYELLRALPDDDNRKFINQAYMHCIFCDHVLVQPGTDQAFDIHFSWLFFPWHRWYVYFHERILQKLLNDPTFSLPFWNWDNQNDTNPLPNSIPNVFIQNEALYDRLRNTIHQPPAIADLAWFPGQPEKQNDPATLRAENNAVVYQQVVGGAKTARLFMGSPYRYGDPTPNFDNSTNFGGSVENGVHGFVHIWTGAEKELAPNNEDMGALFSAARDPIFYAHHANIDRMWWIWKNRGGKEFTDTDWLDSSFLFFDENGDPVKVYIRDALDTNAMGYTYESMPLDWLQARATKSGAATPTATSKLKARSVEIPEFGKKGAGNSKALDAPFSSKVKLPSRKKVGLLFSGEEAIAAEAVAEGEGSETVLVIQGVEVPMDKAVGFNVFINLPDADSSTPKDIKEYAGSFMYLPHVSSRSRSSSGMAMKQSVTTVRLGIGETLDDLGIKDGDTFVVTLVPKDGGDSIVIKGFDIEFE